MSRFNPQPKPTPLPKKTPKPISKRTAKKEAEIEAANKYYQAAFEDNRKRNKGVVLCDECSCVITNLIGRRICHVISGGSYKKLYLHPLNHFVLCVKHTEQEESGDKTTMNIYELWKERRLILLQSLIPENRK